MCAVGHTANRPILPNTGGDAKANVPDTCGSFESSYCGYCKSMPGTLAVLGLLMASGACIVCVDVDDCVVTDGAPNAIGAWALENFTGYCELSQSGRGLHFFMYASVLEGCKVKVKHEASSLDIYSEASVRFIAITEMPHRAAWGGVLDEQAALGRLRHRFGCVP